MTPETLLAHCDQAHFWSVEQALSCGTDVGLAYQQALQVRRLREGRGERPRGYKIGFTNRGIWPRYGVFGPIWGTVWDRSLQFCTRDGVLDLSQLCQPRLEPEAVLCLLRTPPANATAEELFACLDWIAPGFEIVQSHALDWKFNAAMTVADSGLHGRLLVGPQVSVQTLSPTADALNGANAFNVLLASCTVDLSKNGEFKERGCGKNVLDSPLLALLHFLTELRQCPNAPDLQAGDVVTTGTWTDAWPVAAGESWRADFAAPLSPLSVRFV